MASDAFMPEAEIKAVLSSRGFTSKGYLGEGAQGCVLLVVSDRDSLEYGVKVTHANKFCAQEVESLASVWNPYVINIFETFVHDGCRFQVLEYCPGGSLDALVTQTALSSERIYELCHQTVEAVRACHQRGIAHLDIKPQNILIDKYGRAKLADFGLSHATTKGDHTHSRGTFRYMAPELLMGHTFNPLKADIWSLGVTIHFIFVGALPWPEDREEAKKMIVWGLDQTSSCIPLDVANLLRRMINVDPELRPTIDEVFESRALAPLQQPQGMLPLLRMGSYVQKPPRAHGLFARAQSSTLIGETQRMPRKVLTFF
jgi:serine/threonine protein kinase